MHSPVTRAIPDLRHRHRCFLFLVFPPMDFWRQYSSFGIPLNYEPFLVNRSLERKRCFPGMIYLTGLPAHNTRILPKYPTCSLYLMWIMFYVNCYLCSVCTETCWGNAATVVVVMHLEACV
jgi:hypothetical protein